LEKRSLKYFEHFRISVGLDLKIQYYEITLTCSSLDNNWWNNFEVHSCGHACFCCCSRSAVYLASQTWFAPLKQQLWHLIICRLYMQSTLSSHTQNFLQQTTFRFFVCV